MRTEIPSEDGIYDDITDTLYHSDDNSLSSTGARTLLQPGGPALFKGAPKKVTKAFDLGHVVHALVLGKGSDIAVVDAKDWRTKVANEKAEEARAAGKVPILKAMFQEAQRVAGAVHTDPLASVLLEEGEAEQSIFAHDPETGARLRCRPDWHRPGTFVDVKTTKAAAPQLFRKSLRDYGYYQQAPFYLDVAALAGLDIREFYFVAVETTAPYLVSVTQVDERDLELGRRLNRAAIRLYAHCRATKTWPRLPLHIPHIGLTDWERSSAEASLYEIESMLPTTTEGDSRP